MSTQDICTTSSFLILVAESENNASTPDEWDVMEFSSLAELTKLRKRYPEKMKGRYFYALSRGVDAQFRHIHVTEASHFKQFVRQIKNTGVNI